jgi:hypothetical protein
MPAENLKDVVTYLIFFIGVFNINSDTGWGKLS